jgi:hypothetical protein
MNDSGTKMGSVRCASCEHEPGFHHEDGCWFGVAQGRVGSNLVCPCDVTAAEFADES